MRRAQRQIFSCFSQVQCAAGPPEGFAGAWGVKQPRPGWPCGEALPSMKAQAGEDGSAAPHCPPLPCKNHVASLLPV